MYVHNICFLNLPFADNYALSRPTLQSCTFEDYTSEKAVDGIFETDMLLGSCTYLDAEPMPWWTVLLDNNYLVTDVVITNVDSCKVSLHSLLSISSLICSD